MIYSDLTIQRVRDAIDLEELVGSYVDLEAAGKQKKACCPFHHEKTASFFISPDEGFYKCFGCGESGDGISFVMKIEGLDFQGALRFLADRYHIPLEEANPAAKRRQMERELYYSINAEAGRFYYNNLLKSKFAQNYLAKRGFNSAILNDFYLGYADSSSDSLYKHLKGKGYKDEDIMELGLIVPSNRGIGFYDRFRNRLIFPIFSLHDRIIGFGGRALGDNKPKYLNSTESAIFHKGDNLFALNMLRKNRSEDSIILVEGYMDVMSLYFHGQRNAVASLGTSLTENQAKLIKRYGQEVFLCYDGDEAGIRASRRAIDVLSKADVRPKLILLPGGQDPDDVCKNEGLEAFRSYMDKALDPVDFELRILASAFDLNDIAGRSNFLLKAIDFLLTLDTQSLREIYADKIANMLGIEAKSIKADMLEREKRLKEIEAEKGKRGRDNKSAYYKKERDIENYDYEDQSPESSYYQDEEYYDYENPNSHRPADENPFLGIKDANDIILERFRLEREMVRLAMGGGYCSHELEKTRDFLTNPGLKQLFNSIISLREDEIPPEIEWIKKADLCQEAKEQLNYLSERPIYFKDSLSEEKATAELKERIEKLLLRERKAQIYSLIAGGSKGESGADLSKLLTELQIIEQKLRSNGGGKR